MTLLFFQIHQHFLHKLTEFIRSIGQCSPSICFLLFDMDKLQISFTSKYFNTTQKMKKRKEHNKYLYIVSKIIFCSYYRHIL